MKWWKDKPPPLPLVEGETLNLKALSPWLTGTLKACVGKLDRTDLDPGQCEQVQSLYNALSGESYTILTKGLFGEYGAPVEYIKALPPNPKRK